MLVAHYLPKFITALFGGLFVFLGFYTFGNAMLFDRIFFAVLIFTGVICRKNVNVLGVVVIILLLRGMDEVAWVFSEIDNKELVKYVFYGWAAITCYLFRYDKMSYVVIATLVICLSAEMYWLAREKAAPEISWYVFVQILNMIGRHLIFTRVSYTEDWFPGKAESINLDWHYYKLNSLAIVVQLLMVSEYIIRNALGFRDVLIIYYTFPYLMHAFSVYLIWIILNESYRLLLPKLLKA